MSYYDITLEDEKLKLGPIHKIERTAQDITLLGDDDTVIAIFDRTIIKSIVRTTDTVARGTRTVHTIRKIQTVRPKHKQQLPITTHRAASKPKNQYQMRKNKDTDSFEVHVERDTPNDKCPMVFQYKDLIVHALYDNDSNKVYVEKGTLMMKRVMPALENEPSRSGVLEFRDKLIKHSVKNYNSTLYELTHDVEFANLSQAIRALSGADIGPKKYWKRSQGSYSPVAIQQLIELKELIS